jgi:hypothetical protein
MATMVYGHVVLVLASLLGRQTQAASRLRLPFLHPLWRRSLRRRGCGRRSSGPPFQLCMPGGNKFQLASSGLTYGTEGKTARSMHFACSLWGLDHKLMPFFFPSCLHRNVLLSVKYNQLEVGY